MDTIWRDLRYGLRMLLRKPGFAIVSALTLAIGIGANTAIFSLVNGLLLRPLPYPESERLVIMWTHSPGANVAQDWPSPGQYAAVKSGTSVLEDIAIAQGGSVAMATSGAPERVGAIRTSSVMFSLLHQQPLLGRIFLPEDDVPGKPHSAILSYGLWHRFFGGDPGVIGQQVKLDRDSYTVVGVLPADFSLGFEVMPTVGFADQADILINLPMGEKELAEHGDENYNLLARLKPGATISQAQAELDVVARGLQEQHPDNYPPSRLFSFSVKPLLEQVVGDVRPALLVLLGAVGCVLLIACANVANLLLARAASREKEIAIRTALGAGRRRVVRQLLTESLLLATIGGGLGVFVAVWCLAGLRWLNPGNIPRMQNISIDGRVLAFTAAIVLFTGVLFGLAPALRSSRINLSDTLKERSRSLVAGSHRMRSLLVIVETALSLVLLICAGLLIRSFIQVQHVNPGFSAKNVLSLNISVDGTAFVEQPRRRVFYQQLFERIRRLPGVEAAGGATVLPLSGSLSWGNITIEGYDPSSGQSAIQSDRRIATVGYFESMGIRLIRGRLFGDEDTKDSAKVVIIDENMARSYWPNDDPIGKRLKYGGASSTAPWMTVVGVVANVKQYALDSDSRVAMYAPHEQALAGSIFLTIRTAGEPRLLAAAISNEARAIDPNVPVFDIKTMDERLWESLARRRFAMVALGLFAAVAMLLAAVGIYGVMSYSVTQRTREIGIRMALGAPARDVLRLVVGQGMKLAGIGLATGLVGAAIAGRVMTSLLFGISASDPLTFIAIVLTLASAAFVASYFPARRAMRVDPMIALRYE
jgi:putative ABC transport system permease protein